MRNLIVGFKNQLMNVNKLKIINYECHLDDATKKAYVVVSPCMRFIPHNFYVDELVNDDITLQKLEFKSLKYILAIFGVLNSQAKNNFFEVIEELLINNTIKVRNLETLETQLWDIKKFEQSFYLLDKASIKSASEFFSQINPSSIEKITKNEAK